MCDRRQRALVTLSPFGCTSQTLLLAGEEADSASFGGGGAAPPWWKLSGPGRVPLSFGSYNGAPELGWASLGSRPGLWDLSPGCQSSGGRMAGRGAAAGSAQMHPRDCAHSITTRVISPYAGEVTGWSSPNHLGLQTALPPGGSEGSRGPPACGVRMGGRVRRGSGLWRRAGRGQPTRVGPQS